MCYPSGNTCLDVVRVTSWLPVHVTANLLQHCSPVTGSCMLMHESCLLTVSWHRALLSPAMAFIPSASSLNQCSVVQWTDLNWLIQGNTGVVTSVNPVCPMKTAPQHALLYISKCKKPEENLGKLITVLKNVWILLLKQSLTDPVISPQFPHQCSWAGSCRWQSDLMSLKPSFQGSLNSCGDRRLLCRISGVSPGAQSKVSSNPEIWNIQTYFCCYWKAVL